MATVTDRLPWELVETFPTFDETAADRWRLGTGDGTDPVAFARGTVGYQLATYWDPAVRESTEQYVQHRQRRQQALAGARAATRAATADVQIEMVLGELYADWGPDALVNRRPSIEELRDLLPSVSDPELRLRAHEWFVVNALDGGDRGDVESAIDAFVDERRPDAPVLFHRREVLWRANLEMLAGNLDRAVAMNQEIISETAEVAGSPFSFQNVAITLAIERYFRGGLLELEPMVRSILASSPRVAPNWECGLTFVLSETEQFDEALAGFDRLAADGFAAVPRDINWLVSMTLLGLVATTLGEPDRAEAVRTQLMPFVGRNATHGSGYASYGPVARVLGGLAAVVGAFDDAEAAYETALASPGAGPWASLTRHDRARDFRHVDPARSLGDATTAAEELAAIGAHHWAERATTLRDELRLEGHGGAVARLIDGEWHLRHRTGAAVVRDSIGAQALLALLERAGVATEAWKLDPRVTIDATPASTMDATLDDTARREIRARLAELVRRRRLAPAQEEEQSALRRALAGAGYRRSSSAEEERARVRITKALRRAIATIDEESPELGEHLASSISTGRRCAYLPADGQSWQIDRTP